MSNPYVVLSVARTGFIDTIFDACVDLLVWTASLCGTSYKAINVYIFVIAWPLLLAVMAVLVMRQRRKIATLEAALRESRTTMPS